jgi:dehydrogenase/reductase SDR family protein 12
MSLYRNVVWYVGGLRNYTKQGFEKASAKFGEDAYQTPASVIITGANSGIGKSAALQLASTNATVHMVCRSQNRGEAAREEIVEASGNKKVFLHIVDMSSASDINSFVDEMKAQDKISVLVNNAGCMVNERRFTDDGHELNYATNILGTVQLTEGLIPLMEENGRVITVSSGGMLLQKLNEKDPGLTTMSESDFEGTMVYAQQKRQQVVLTELWAKQHTGITFVSMHPGWADTPAVASSMPDFHKKMEGRLRTSTEGADTIVWLAQVASLPADANGAFFQDRAPVAKHLPLAWTRSSDAEKQTFFKTVRDSVNARVESLQQ